LARQYTGFARGVHGGAHKAEMLVPIVLIASDDQHVDLQMPSMTLELQAISPPNWWELESTLEPTVQSTPVPSTYVPPTQKIEAPSKPTAQASLFDFSPAKSRTETTERTENTQPSVFRQRSVMIAMG